MSFDKYEVTALTVLFVTTIFFAGAFIQHNLDLIMESKQEDVVFTGQLPCNKDKPIEPDNCTPVSYPVVVEVEKEVISTVEVEVVDETCQAELFRVQNEFDFWKDSFCQ